MFERERGTTKKDDGEREREESEPETRGSKKRGLVPQLVPLRRHWWDLRHSGHRRDPSSRSVLGASGATAGGGTLEEFGLRRDLGLLSDDFLELDLLRDEL